MEILWLTLIVFAACFVQGVSGFGSALVAMPLLVSLYSLNEARPLCAIMSTLLQIIVLARYHRSFNFRAVLPLVLSAAVAVPIGFFGLQHLDQHVTLLVLAIIVLAYAAYNLSGAKAPHVTSRVWAVVAGFFGGLLGAAYNTSGPPVVLYADARRWSPEVFKSNLQGFFIANNLFVLVGHFSAGYVTRDVMIRSAIMLPAVVAGLAVAFILDRYIGHATFRKIVLVMLVILGGQLLARALGWW